MDYYIHPKALVETKNIGADTKIWQNVVILEKAVIGKNCNINCNCFIENDVFVGDNVTLKCGVYLWDTITIENDVFIGPNATFTNDLRPRSKRYLSEHQKTIVKRGASIGAGSVIIGGITIGEYAFIGAGAVVTKNIPNNTLWYGNPAKFKGYICNCGNNLNIKYECQECGKRYSLENEIIVEIRK